MPVRFDDTLKTVLASDTTPGLGAQSTWRQLIDLIGRGRISADDDALARLRRLRQAVPLPVRAASARALAFATPPAGLVALLADDDLAVAAPVLRTAVLTADEWTTLIPALTPVGRSILRQRRDLPPAAGGALAAFGSVDFVIEHRPVDQAPEQEIVEREETDAASSTDMPPAPVAMADIAATPMPAAAGPGFVIADLVARIDAFNRTRPAPAHELPTPADTAFRFEADAGGTIRWVDGIARPLVVGMSIAQAAAGEVAGVDGGVAGAFRRRSPFADARLTVAGDGIGAGSWRIAGVPLFDPASGRFTGYRGIGRRPRADQQAEPLRRNKAASESLRHLVHELRTPANAISGFAELIESELFGPVAPTYRERAGAIRGQAGGLVAAIDDLDTAARIEGGALDLHVAPVALTPLVTEAIADLAPLAALRGASVAFTPADEIVAHGDDRAIARLIGRLLAVAVAACRRDERLVVELDADGGSARLAVDRPAAMTVLPDGALLSIDAEIDRDDGASLLGSGFALRLARNLAHELGGSLVIDATSLTLRLPAAEQRDVDRAII